MKKRGRKTRRKLNMGKGIILFIMILLLLFVAFPRMGIYAFLFDNEQYSNTDESTTELISSLDELSPRTRELAMEFLQKCEENGLSVRITETYRTQARQDILYEQGRTTAGPMVTWTKNSKHSERRAFDICEDNTNDPYGDLEFFRKCAEIGKEVGLTPGYYFKGYQDMPHYELNSWWLP